MPSKNMLPKGKRRQTVKHDYRAARTLAQEQAAAAQKARAEAFGEEPEETADELLKTADFMEPELTLDERIASNNWITTKGATGSKVAAETHDAPRYANPYAALHEQPSPEIEPMEDLEAEDGIRSFNAAPVAAGMRLDAYLAKALPEISRARVQMLIEAGQVRLDGEAVKAKQKLKGGELIEIEGEARPEPIHATPEDIPLTVVHEDDDLAVIDKPAGMMVHAGSGSSEHNRGTLVNALLYRFGENLSEGSEVARPGIVHRLDKDTSGLIIVAKNDVTHRKLSEMFSGRHLRKVYLALVHGWPKEDEGSITLPISRDLTRRTRMTTKRPGGRTAISNWKVLERLETAYGKFALLEVHIETGRTHQIRVHLQAVGHPVVGDTLYGAPLRLVPAVKRKAASSVELSGIPELSLDRNFLHAAELEFVHPRTGATLALNAELPAGLVELLERLRGTELIP